jgi:hypothetical protein
MAKATTAYTGHLAELFARVVMGALTEDVLRQVAGEDVTPALLGVLERLCRRKTCSIGWPMPRSVPRDSTATSSANRTRCRVAGAATRSSVRACATNAGTGTKARCSSRGERRVAQGEVSGLPLVTRRREARRRFRPVGGGWVP